MRKVALVTGGAKGIGAAIASELAANNFDVVINYLTSEKEAEKLGGELTFKYGVNVLLYKCDVSKEDEVNAMVEFIESKLGGVDVLINNAAIDLSSMWHEKKV